MGAKCFQDKEKKSKFHNRHEFMAINNNYYNKCRINNLFYNNNLENIINNKKNGICCLVCGEPGGKNFGGGGKRHNNNCMKCGKKERYGEFFRCKICNSTFCSKCPYQS